MKLLPLLSCTLPVLLLSGPAMAAVVNFDFNRRLTGSPDNTTNVIPETYVGLGAAPDSAADTHWNSVRRSSSSFVSSGAAINSPILDSAGLSTSINVQIDTDIVGTAAIGHERSVGAQELGASGAYTNLMGDFLQVDANGTDTGAVGTAVGTFSGLTIGGLYDIYFYGQGELYGAAGNSNSGQNSFFAITNGSNGSIIGTGKQTGWDGTSGGNGSLTEGIEYVKFTATADSAGKIYFIWQNVVAGQNVVTDAALDSGGNGSSDYGALNGIQIVSVVPEPSAALLGLLGMAGLFRRRRR